MCGIVGYIGQGDAEQNIILGLKKLEYRGYDSWGVASFQNNKVKIYKKVGRISAQKSHQKSKSHLAIGHTRWATHGKVTTANAHPQTDCDGKIALVHNGIIENHQELRKKLTNLGHQFLSDTDTEVIPHLIEENLKKEKNFLHAFRESLLELHGNFAINLINQKEEKIYAASHGCPLVVGLSNNGKFISSDILAFDKKVQKVLFLKDFSMVELDKANIKVIDFRTGKNKKNNFIKLQTRSDNVSLGKFDHYLFKEINEQPNIISKIAKFDQKELESNAALIRNSFGTFFVSCGTAYHAGLIGSYFFAQNAKMHVNIISAGEFANFQSFITSRTLLLAISQSGETADVLEAVKTAKSKKSKVLALVNNPNSSLARLADVVMVTPAGPEIAVLSTKAFTAQTEVLFLLSKAISGDLEKARYILQKCSLAMADNLSSQNIKKYQKLAQRIKNAEHIFTIGRSLNFPTALEAALKIKEVSYIHAEGYAGSDLKHGPIALIEKGTPCLVFVGSDEVKAEILSNAAEVKARGGYIIGVAPENDEVFDCWIKVANIPKISPLINIVPMQVLAYFLALEKHLDPDKPRNLAKSVTVK